MHFILVFVSNLDHKCGMREGKSYSPEWHISLFLASPEDLSIIRDSWDMLHIFGDEGDTETRRAVMNIRRGGTSQLPPVTVK